MAEDTDEEEIISSALKKNGGGESQTYHGLLRPPLIIFSFTAIYSASHGQRLVHVGAARAPLISGCVHTSGMKRGEKSDSPLR